MRWSRSGMKNGMGKKAAADDAEMTVDDYVATPADNYKFMAEHERAGAEAVAAHRDAGSQRSRNRQSPAAEAIGCGGGDLAEDVIEQQPAGGGQRDARAVALEMARARRADRLALQSTIDSRPKRSAIASRIDPFAQPQAHDQRFVGGFARRERRLLGDAVAVAPQRRQEILGLPVAHRAHAKPPAVRAGADARHNRRSASK